MIKVLCEKDVSRGLNHEASRRTNPAHSNKSPEQPCESPRRFDEIEIRLFQDVS